MVTKKKAVLDCFNNGITIGDCIFMLYGDLMIEYSIF